MDSFVERTKQIIYIAPVKVNFAGIRGDTRAMVNDGWNLNVYCDKFPHMDGYSIMLAGRHEALGLKMRTGHFFLDRRAIMQMYSNNHYMPHPMEHIEFQTSIENCTQHISINSMEKSSAPIVESWNGMIECYQPTKTWEFDDFFGFPTKSAIFIPEKQILTVQQHLDAIMKIQQPTQEEILKLKLGRKDSQKEIMRLVAA